MGGVTSLGGGVCGKRLNFVWFFCGGLGFVLLFWGWVGLVLELLRFGLGAWFVFLGGRGWFGWGGTCKAQQA